MRPIGTAETAMIVKRSADLGFGLSDVTSSVNDVVGSAVSSAVTGAIAPKLDSLLYQARLQLAQQQGKDPSQVTDLELARYFSNMPSANLTDEIAVQMGLMTQSVRNALLIMGGTIAFAILLGKLSDRRRSV